MNSCNAGAYSKDQNYCSNSAAIHALQNVRNQNCGATMDEKKALNHQKNMEHCKNVNYKRLVESSNEIRELVFATNDIEAGKINLGRRQLKERENFNKRLDDLHYGANYRAEDEIWNRESAGSEKNLHKQQRELGEFYDGQIAEKKHQQYMQYIALEEEKQHRWKVVREEAQRKKDEEMKREIEKKRWQNTITEFKDDKERDRLDKIEKLRQEDERIRNFEQTKYAQNKDHKEIQRQREEIADGLRDQLAIKIQARENADREKEAVDEELMVAEMREAELMRKKIYLEKKAVEKRELIASAELSTASKLAQKAKEKQDWQDYIEIMKKQMEQADRKEEAARQRRADLNADTKNELFKQMADRKTNMELEKHKKERRDYKDNQDKGLWEGFVANEKERYLRGRFDQIGDFMDGFNRFPHKKDNKLFAELVDESKANGGRITKDVRNEHPLSSIDPPACTPYEVYRNMHHARLHEMFAIGAK